MTTEAIRRYWNERIHDLEMTSHPVGTREFFADLDDYRFDKLRYLPELVDFTSFKGQRLLEIGCGIGTDLAALCVRGRRGHRRGPFGDRHRPGAEELRAASV